MTEYGVCYTYFGEISETTTSLYPIFQAAHRGRQPAQQFLESLLEASILEVAAGTNRDCRCAEELED